MSGLERILFDRLSFAGGLVQIDSSGNINLTPLAGQSNKITGNIALQDAIAQVIPGLTSISFRNNANNQDNFIIQDAGTATLFGALTVPSLKDATGVNVINLNSSSNITYLNGVATKGHTFSGTNPVSVSSGAGTSAATYLTVNGTNGGATTDATAVNGGGAGLLLITGGAGGSSVGGTGGGGSRLQHFLGVGGVSTNAQGGAGGAYSSSNTDGNTLIFVGNSTAFGSGGNTPSNTVRTGIGTGTGGNGGTNGGAGGIFVTVLGNGGTGAAGAGGAGGYYLLVAGNGNTGVTVNRGGHGGGITFVTGNGGNGSTSGGSGGAFKFLSGNGGLGTSSSGGTGGGFVVTSGNAGATTATATGGDVIFNLGTGNLVGNIEPALANGRHGYFEIIAPVITGSTGFPSISYVSGFYPQFVVNCNGWGLGTTAYKGSPINAVWVDTDPTYPTQYTFAMKPILNSDCSFSIQSHATTLHLAGPGAITNTDGNGGPDNEVHVRSTGSPTHAYLRGGYQKIHLENLTTLDHVTLQKFNGLDIPTAANITLGYGIVGEITHQGTGTIVTGASLYGSIVVGGNVTGYDDGQITSGYCYESNISFVGTQSIGGTGHARSVISTGTHYYAQTPFYGGSTTGVITEVWGFKSDAQFNSKNHTSATTDTYIAGGAKLTVSTQTFTATGTATNYGMYITGNGGSAPSGGGTVTNWALYSDSTAPSSFAGKLITKVSATGAAPLGAGFNIPHGAAPTTSITDGDIWTTTAGLFVRINGSTKTVTLT